MTFTLTDRGRRASAETPFEARPLPSITKDHKRRGSRGDPTHLPLDATTRVCNTGKPAHGSIKQCCDPSVFPSVRLSVCPMPLARNGAFEGSSYCWKTITLLSVVAFCRLAHNTYHSAVHARCPSAFSPSVCLSVHAGIASKSLNPSGGSRIFRGG